MNPLINNLRVLFLSTIILNEPSPSIKPDQTPGFTVAELKVENFFKSNCLNGILAKEFQPCCMLKPRLIPLFFSKPFRVRLKSIKCELIDLLSSTLCSFTIILFSIVDLDTRLSILFSQILRLITVPE